MEQKVLVFGMLEREGKVHVEVVPNVQVKMLVGAACQHIRPGSTIYTDGLSSYSSLLLYGYECIRVDYERRFANGKVHSNGLEGFWSTPKSGGHSTTEWPPWNFDLYIKEMEFRYNHRGEDSLFGYLNQGGDTYTKRQLLHGLSILVSRRK